MTPWEIKAREFANCNCAYGCPCQFNALPTKGFCEAAVAMEIDEGHYGDVKLDGLRMGGIFQWPGAVHEGRGKCQPFVDERADAAAARCPHQDHVGSGHSTYGDHVRGLLLDT